MMDLLKGMFLLILAISGNFIAETLSCKTQKHLSNNMYLKHSIIILMIYFVINLMDNKIKHPRENFKATLFVYISFLIITKMNIYFTLLSFLLLTSIFIIENYIIYYKKKKINKYKELYKIQTKLLYLLCGIIILGFSLYFIKQRNDHKKNWNSLKFIFGVIKCDNNK